MVRGKHKNILNRNKGYLASPEPRSPTTASPAYSNRLEKQDLDLKSLLMMVIEDFKKDINNFLKEIQENTAKQVEDFKRKHKNPLKNYRRAQLNKALEEETHKLLKKLQANTTKQVK